MPTVTDQLITQIKMQDALLARLAEQSLRAFVEQAWVVLQPHTPFVANWHIDLICEYLEAVTDGEIRRLLINLPPRHMKSYLISILWPVWEWLRHPGHGWVFASYAETLALQHSLARRTLLQSDWYQERWGHRIQLAVDQNLKAEFSNTERGTMIATSVGGSITGKGGDCLVVDDLHNPQQAASDTQREQALNYFQHTLFTRLDSRRTGRIVVVMQRLHDADLSAFCLKQGFTHLCLPAEAEIHTTIVFPRSGHVVARVPGDLLWPAREGHEELAELKQVLGSTAYAAQYQQQPVPAGGAIFRREWIRFYDTAPAKFDQIAQSWDMAFKDTPDSDFVVGLVAGRIGADIYLLDRCKDRCNFTETCSRVRAMYQRYPRTQAIFIEEAANGAAVIASLGRELPGVIGIKPDGGKVSRAHAAQPRVEAGNIHLPNPCPNGRPDPTRAWVYDFVDQLVRFPRGAHDDDVDAFTQLVVQWLVPPHREWINW